MLLLTSVRLPGRKGTTRASKQSAQACEVLELGGYLSFILGTHQELAFLLGTHLAICVAQPCQVTISYKAVPCLFWDPMLRHRRNNLDCVFHDLLIFLPGSSNPFICLTPYFSSIS